MDRPEPKPIPTIYAEVEFRSRLEARWAIYFDLMNIPWVYEPFGPLEFRYPDGSFAQYLPDFLITGRDLVEVKPDATSFDKARNFMAFGRPDRINTLWLLTGQPAQKAYLSVTNYYTTLEMFNDDLFLGEDDIDPAARCFACYAARRAKFEGADIHDFAFDHPDREAIRRHVEDCRLSRERSRERRARWERDVVSEEEAAKHIQNNSNLDILAVLSRPKKKVT